MDGKQISGIQIPKSAHHGAGAHDYELKVLYAQTALMEAKINQLVVRVNELTATIGSNERP